MQSNGKSAFIDIDRVHRSKSRRGAIVVLMAVLLPVMLILAGFAINLCYIELVRTELQIASDAASRAAARTILNTGDHDAALAAARAVCTKNLVAGVQLPIDSSDLLVGSATRSGMGQRYVFNEGALPYNAVKLNANSLSDQLGGSLPMPIRFGFGSVNISPSRLSVVTRAELDLALVVDRSGSMAYGSDEIANIAYPPYRAAPGWVFGDPVPPGSRWLEARTAVSDFLLLMQSSPQDELVSVSTYNHASSVDVALTNNYASINTALNNYSTAFQAGGTNIGDGLYAGISCFSSSRLWAVKVIIVLTDGINNWGPDPLAAANHAASQHVVLYTITFSDEADQALMQQIATIGSGKHYHAANLADLQDAFREIANDLPLLLTE